MSRRLPSMLRPCIAHLPRSQKLDLLCCLCFVLILHGAEVFSAHSSASAQAAHSRIIIRTVLSTLLIIRMYVGEFHDIPEGGLVIILFKINRWGTAQKESKSRNIRETDSPRF